MYTHLVEITVQDFLSSGGFKNNDLYRKFDNVEAPRWKYYRIVRGN